MKVYMVFITHYSIDAEYDEMLGVFSTIDKAKEYISKSEYEKDVKENDIFIRECNVDAH